MYLTDSLYTSEKIINLCKCDGFHVMSWTSTKRMDIKGGDRDRGNRTRLTTKVTSLVTTTTIYTVKQV